MRCPIALAICGAAVVARAQVLDALPTEHCLRIAPGSHVDLDTGLVLPAAAFPPHRADLAFDRDGAGLHVDLPGGAAAAEGLDAAVPPRDGFEAGRRYIAWRQPGPHVFFVRTDRRCLARVRVEVVDPYSTGTVLLTWVVVPEAASEFWPGPQRLTASWEGDALRVRWQSDGSRWLVHFRAGERAGSMTVDRPEVAIPDALPASRCAVEVRGLREGGVVTLPARLVRFPPDRPAQRGEVRFADRWYDSAGGLELGRGEVAERDADVVFHLYGVYAPGGGVQKVGRGAVAFASLARLPAAGYLPLYGRLDADDVLAVRTADGRCAKLILVPVRDGDLRSGMVVRYAFLADGRDELVPAPGGLAFERAAGGIRLTWAPAAGALRYRAEIEGHPARETTATELLVAGLAPDRFHRLRLQAVDALGDRSDAAEIEAHTFGAGHRVGSFALPGHGEQGWCLERECLVALNDDVVGDVDLAVCGRAGNASFSVRAPHGCAPAGTLAFGGFPAPGDERRWTERFDADERDRPNGVFLLRSRAGALASVRIRTWSHEPVFDYVLRR